ncbi:hypothetical protein QR680_016884 [Steinernema hermaphroditum]|uniref:7TM GPCR serpentine receptor class x (Srx) domain-containing protein n=1 Tax=Steinernema hermaphroditum TaxID=289476 RepID=A0AA39HCL0_9BILA|nr:hypothetical protein QR680_016884 [Steinernema hermaphroditum]
MTEFGANLKGRGYATQTDLIAGAIVLGISFTAMTFGVVNLSLINQTKLWHNAFGRLAAWRTFGEVCCNCTCLLYSAPVTFLSVVPRGAEDFPFRQPTTLSYKVGVAFYLTEKLFGFSACLIQPVISLNRLAAVYFPIKYNVIFQKKMCFLFIALTLMYSSAAVISYMVLPCSLLGYSPTLYKFVRLGCPEGERPLTSISGKSSIALEKLNDTSAHRGVGSICVSMAVTFRQMISKRTIVDKDSGRNIRFFIQSVLQNVSMMTAMTMVCFCRDGAIVNATVTNIIIFNSYNVAHVCNAITMIMLIPEFRRKLSNIIPLMSGSS